MSTDFRALCDELANTLERAQKALRFEGGCSDATDSKRRALIDRARAALAAEADGPTVQSREPASVVGEPSDEELLDIAAQAIDGYSSGIKLGEYEAENEIAVEAYGSELITFARAALARYGHQPAPAAEGEVAELVEGLKLISDGMDALGHESDSWFVARAADLLSIAYATGPEVWEPIPLLPARRHPTPVPVSERPWERDGWCDDEDRCWCMSSLDGPPPRWWLVRPEPLSDGWVLPFNALPLPQGEVQP